MINLLVEILQTHGADGIKYVVAQTDTGNRMNDSINGPYLRLLVQGARHEVETSLQSMINADIHSHVFWASWPADFLRR